MTNSGVKLVFSQLFFEDDRSQGGKLLLNFIQYKVPWILRTERHNLRLPDQLVYRRDPA